MPSGGQACRSWKKLTPPLLGGVRGGEGLTDHQAKQRSGHISRARHVPVLLSRGPCPRRRPGAAALPIQHPTEPPAPGAPARSPSLPRTPT